jgi:acetyl esterase/lipase
MAGTILSAAFLPAAAQTPPAPQALASAVDPMANVDADMGRVLSALQALGPKPIETLEPAEARRQPTPADAVARIAKDEKLDAKPHAGLQVSESRFADMGNLHLRFYVPEGATRDSNLPVILYFRGGGWVIGTLDSYDATPAALARKAKAAVISVEYPLAPTEKFPAAHDEAIDAYKYLLKNAKDWGYDPSRIALVGEGAGGNLAINTAIAARDRNLPRPAAVVAIYPLATTAMDTPSKREQATAKPLNTAMVTWLLGHAVRNDSDRQDPRLNLTAADLKGLPPVTVINAAIDPLRSDGDLLVGRLKDAGVETTHRLYPGVTHGFFGMDAVVAKAREAQDFAVSQIKRAYEGARPPAGGK